MSVSVIILTILLAMLLFGFLDRFLDKMRISDKTALLVLLLIVLGLVIPPIWIDKYFAVSLGGFVVPFGVCIYVLFKVGASRDLVRAIIGSFLTAGLVVAVQFVLPADPEAVVIEPAIVYGLIAGVVAYVLGRSRRNAFVCAVLGISLASVTVWLINWCMGVKEVLGLGTGGFFNTILVGVVFAVGFAVFFGKGMERVFPDNNTKVLNEETGVFDSEKNGRLEKFELVDDDKKEMIVKTKNKKIKKSSRKKSGR